MVLGQESFFRKATAPLDALQHATALHQRDAGPELSAADLIAAIINALADLILIQRETRTLTGPDGEQVCGIGTDLAPVEGQAE